MPPVGMLIDYGHDLRVSRVAVFRGGYGFGICHTIHQRCGQDALGPAAQIQLPIPLQAAQGQRTIAGRDGSDDTRTEGVPDSILYRLRGQVQAGLIAVREASFTSIARVCREGHEGAFLLG